CPWAPRLAWPAAALAALDSLAALDPLDPLDPPSSDDGLMYSELQLTEEEQKLLNQEGISLPNNLPLTKAEERVLKKVRRKIRNKQSAQDSRRRRKDYIDGLEGSGTLLRWLRSTWRPSLFTLLPAPVDDDEEAAACSAQNKDLQRTVEQLEKRNISLLTQLRQLQSLIKQTVTKGAQTSTCLLIILVSLGLIILPSFSPFRRHVDDDSRPIGVISRNILTDPSSSSSSSSSSQSVAGGIESPAAQSDSSSPPSALSQSGRPEGAALVPQEPTENPENLDVAGTAQGGEQRGNSLALVAEPTAARRKSRDADEM
ncbi:unnamed protein product, partial [Pleuronectes platessa]